MQKIQRWCDACGKNMSDNSYWVLRFESRNEFITLARDKKYDLCHACRAIMFQAVKDALGKIDCVESHDEHQEDVSKIVWKAGCRVIPQGGK